MKVPISLVITAWIVPACHQTCEFDPAFVATPSIACAAADLCYQGECLAACNAGRERVEICREAEDCTDSARPHCIERRCSACTEGESCVPTLNVCRSVVAREVDGGVPSMGPPLFTPRSDAGTFEPRVFPRDAGTQVEEEHPTHIARLELIGGIQYPGARPFSAVDFEALDIRGIERTESATVTPPSVQTDARCDVLSNTAYDAPPNAVDLGPLSLANPDGMVGALTHSPFELSFSSGAYRVLPEWAADSLDFSGQVIRSIEMTSPGSEPLGIAPYPINHRTFETPFELVPASGERVENGQLEDTPALLRTGIRVRRPAAEGLALRWTDEGSSRAEKVEVQVDGPAFHLKCRADPGAQRIFIPARILDTFRTMNRLEEGAEHALRFKRSLARRVAVPTAREVMTQISFEVEIAHVHQTSVRFD